MLNKNKIKKYVSTVGIFLSVFILAANDLHHGAFANTDNVVNAYPYQKTFTISAYYSPLPCQNKYVTGSYEGDIRLNGSGVNSADGTPVYPGMIAAPKTYSFGTKLYIPEIGIVAVHDRGGAIVTAGNRNQNYDRLDVWMGYGDKGLYRALGWGKRNVNVTVYGITDSVIEDINLPGYSASESIPTTNCQFEYNSVMASVNNDFEIKLASIDSRFKKNLTDYFNAGLKFGDNGNEVTALQNELKNMNFYRIAVTGEYDELTVHAIFKFQQSQGIVDDVDTLGAGYFGPKTREKFNEIIANRNYTKALIAQTTYEVGGRFLAEAYPL